LAAGILRDNAFLCLKKSRLLKRCRRVLVHLIYASLSSSSRNGGAVTGASNSDTLAGALRPPPPPAAPSPPPRLHPKPPAGSGGAVATATAANAPAHPADRVWAVPPTRRAASRPNGHADTDTAMMGGHTHLAEPRGMRTEAPPPGERRQGGGVKRKGRDAGRGGGTA
jgi:hypothetical protein